MLDLSADQPTFPYDLNNTDQKICRMVHLSLRVVESNANDQLTHVDIDRRLTLGPAILFIMSTKGPYLTSSP
jgi:hypothetical protein